MSVRPGPSLEWRYLRVFYTKKTILHVGVEPKIGVDFTPKMDGEQMDDLGGFPIFFGNTHVWTGISTPTFKGLTEIYGINL